MHGLPQAGKFSHDKFKNHLKKHGYQHVKFTPGLWTHKYRPISFTLIVDYFGINCVVNKNAKHIIQALQNYTKLQSIGKINCILNSVSIGIATRNM